MNPTDFIAQYKREHRAVVAAHTYQAPAVQASADILGDSFALAQKAAETDADVIIGDFRDITDLETLLK